MVQVEDTEKIQEVTVIPAAATEISLDAAVAALLSTLDFSQRFSLWKRFNLLLSGFDKSFAHHKVVMCVQCHHSYQQEASSCYQLSQLEV